MSAVLMRIEQRGDEWVVLPENGDKVLGTHKTKADAEKQLAAIEASKARAAQHARFERWCKSASCGTFSSERGADGKVRSGVWDRVCVPGHDEKDGMSTDFDVDTLSQMVENFEQRGDLIPIDYNHQSNYSHVNGQPAPALGWYGALAAVFDGKVVKLGCAQGVSVTGAEEGLDLGRDGLWAYRCEVTELGDQLLPNFKYVSPTFMSNGTLRDGTEIGYCLAAVAATNTPWQGGTEITFQRGEIKMAYGEPVKVGDRVRVYMGSARPGKETKGVVTEVKGNLVYVREDDGTVDAHDKSEVSKMDGATSAHGAKMSKLAKFAGVDEGADKAAIKTALAETMTKLASDAMYEDDAAKLEDAAVQMDEAAAEMEDDDEDKAKLSKMAAKFHKMAAKMDGTQVAPKPAPGPSETESGSSKLEDDSAKAGDKAAMAVMQASLAGLQARLAKFERADAEREKAAKAEREKAVEALADAAVAGGYPKENRGDLVLFARANLSAAKASVAHFLPKTGAPAHVFSRMTNMGAPIGSPDANAREFGAGAPKPRVVTNPIGRFVEVDSGFADEIKRVAEAKDPVTMAKVDKHLPESQRAVMFNRLIAAERIVRAERPELAEAAENQ